MDWPTSTSKVERFPLRSHPSLYSPYNIATAPIAATTSPIPPTTPVIAAAAPALVPVAFPLALRLPLVLPVALETVVPFGLVSIKLIVKVVEAAEDPPVTAPLVIGAEAEDVSTADEMTEVVEESL